MKVSKEFWVSNEHFDKINKSEEVAIIIRNKDESCFSDSVINKAVNKITISYEIDREVTIKESDIDRLFSNNARFTYRDIEIMKECFSEAVRMSKMKYQKEFEELASNNPDLLGGNTLAIQTEHYGVPLDTPEYASSYVRLTYNIFCKIKEQLEQEIKTLKERLAKAEQRIFHAPHCITNYERNDCDCGYERYFKEKQDKENKDEK